MITSGATFYVNEDVLAVIPSVTRHNNQGPAKNMNDDVKQEENDMLLLRLKVAEHLASLRRCFCAFGKQIGGGDTSNCNPKNLRIKTKGAQDLLKKGNVESKTFSLEMGIQLLTTSLPLAASTGVTFPLFVRWLIQLSMLRYRRFQLSPAEKFHKLITQNIEVALINVPTKNLVVAHTPAWLPGYLMNDKVKEQWLPFAIDT